MDKGLILALNRSKLRYRKNINCRASRKKQLSKGRTTTSRPLWKS